MRLTAMVLALALGLGASNAFACEGSEPAEVPTPEPEYVPQAENNTPWRLAGVGFGGALLGGVGVVVMNRRRIS